MRDGGVARALLTLGPRSSDGYGIDIVRVDEQRDRVVIVARERAPSSSERTRGRVTFPAIIVVVPDREKPIAVEWQGR